MNDKVKIYATYSDCCFCDRPTLGLDGPTVVTNFRPRFNWRTAVNELAAKLNAVSVWHSQKEKTSTAVLPIKCAHRETTAIRFDWTMIYK